MTADLAQDHLEMLHASGISDAVIAERGYFTATKKVQLADLGFGASQQHVPALVIPVISPTGDIALYQTRPDQPRIKDGKALKYEMPAGARMAVDVPPAVCHLLGNPKLPLFVTEGVKKGDALASRGLCAVALLGVWNFRGTNDHGGKVLLADFEHVALNGRDVFIVFDSDVMLKAAVHGAMSRLGAVLANRGARVRYVYLPTGIAGEKVGVDDYLVQGHSIDNLLALATSELRTPPSERRGERRTIVANGRYVREVTAEALEVLTGQDEPVLYLRGNVVTRLTGNPPLAEQVSGDALRGTLDRMADFVTVDDKGDERPARVPRDVTADILSLPNPPFPSLAGVLSTPVFLRDGRLLRENGFDADSGYFVALRELDGLDDVRPADARSILIDELLGDFPFADEGSRAHAVATMLQPFVRPLIDGPVPLYLIDAPTRGTGKTLLADVTALVTLGGPAPVMSLPRDDDEIEKRITSVLIAGAPLIVLDNVTALRGGPLAAVLTTTEWSGRVLGRSQVVRVRNTATWLATGNNVELSDELGRRVIPIRLDAGVAQPEERTDFRHPDLIAWLRTQRSEVVAACVSLVRSWVDAGCPAGRGRLGRFESWAAVMGGILEVAEIDGFLSNRQAMVAEGDRLTGDWLAFCGAWDECYGERPVTAKDLLGVAKQRQLLLDVWGGRTELGAQQRFGHALARNRDRVFGDHRIETAGQDARTGNAAYRMTLAEDTRNTRNTDKSTGVSGVSGASHDKVPVEAGTSGDREFEPAGVGQGHEDDDMEWGEL